MKFFQDYLEEKYSRKLYRVPIDPGFGCPYALANRCFFCDESGARPAHISPQMPIEDQIKKGVEFVRRNYGQNAGLIAYVQTHTGTNAPPEKLKQIYDFILRIEKFNILIISTRPDSINKQIINILENLSKEIELWIELGVQTSNNSTLKLINRKHDFSKVKDTVFLLDSHKINTAAHIILGLPGEGICDFRKTASKISELPFKAIKIHNLLILKNTVFEQWFNEGKIKVMNEHEYAAILLDFVKHLRQDILLMRICADTDESKLIAPKWNLTKNQFIHMFRTLLQNNETSKFSKIPTADSSYTLYHPKYKDYYRSLYGARTESEKIFINPCEIRKKLKEKKYIYILEIGFGIGYNLRTTLEFFNESNNKTTKLEYLAFENDFSGLENAISLDIIEKSNKEIFIDLLNKKSFSNKNLKIQIIEGDARKNIQKIMKFFDAIYLDPFAPDRNIELWTYDFIKEITKKMKNDSILATYSSAYPVRGAMIRAGLFIGDILSSNRKKATIAALQKELIPNPIPQKEFNIIMRTTTGLPYRDPGLCSSIEKIIDLRKKTLYKLR
ncbi:MAG TPA: TIGR01212 family radical SAM protein, partial [Victivallales bacterium]|nr:TIGR01212 family radical SAM protein [Victivallales bacterium]